MFEREDSGVYAASLPVDAQRATHAKSASAIVVLVLAVAHKQFPQWYPWVLCGLRTGMRAGELLAFNGGHQLAQLPPHHPAQYRPGAA